MGQAGANTGSASHAASRAADSQVRFVDVAPAMGVEFMHHNDAQPGRFFLPETMGSGVGWIDFDGDGSLDLFLINGCRLPVDISDRSHTSHLYRNQTDSWSDVTDLAHIGLVGFGQGCAVADYDNDGFSDLFVTCFGMNTLYHNQGDGTFRDATERAGLSSVPRWHSGCAFGDLDRDGDLDLYVATYVETSLAKNPTCVGGRNGTRRIYCGPGFYSAEPDLFFENRGDESFRDQTVAAGFEAPDGKGLGVAVADLDGDGWPDVYVANDMTANFFFHNASARGSGLTFQEMAKVRGLAFSGDGEPEAGMGISCGDFDGNGLLDLVVTNYFHQKATLYLAGAASLFRDASAATGLTAATRRSLGFGVAFLDVDNDGWLDLFISNGHVVDLGDAQTPYAMQPQLFRNRGGRKLIELTNDAGPYFSTRWLGRGAAVADFDNDGAVDFAVSHLNEAAAILHNESSSANGFLGLVPVGAKSNRTAIGLRAIATERGGRTLMREVTGGGSYLSASDYRILLGIEDGRTVQKLQLHWPSGEIQEVHELECGAYYRVQEGRSPTRIAPPRHGTASSFRPRPETTDVP